MGRDEAWEDVGEQFKKLGGMFRDHFEAQQGEGASDADVDESVRNFGENVQAAFAALIDSVKDPEVHDGAREAAGSFFEALGSTFSELGADVRQRDDELPDTSEDEATDD